MRSGFAGFLSFFFATLLAALPFFLTAVRGAFLAEAFFVAGCLDRFDETFVAAVLAFVPGRFFVTDVRDLVLAGDLRVGFLTMVILTSR